MSINSKHSKNSDFCKSCSGTGFREGKACLDCPHHIIKEKQHKVDNFEKYPHNTTLTTNLQEGHLQTGGHLHSQGLTGEAHTNIITNIPVTAEVPTTTLKSVTKEMHVTAEVPTHTLKSVTQNMSVTAEVPTTNLKTVTTNVPIIAEVPVTTIKTVTQNIPVTAEVPVTNLKKVRKMVEVETEVPVTVLKTVKKLVEVETEVPVTELKEVTRMIPITTEVPVHTTKRIEAMMPVDTSVPVDATKRVTANINVESTVPVSAMKQFTTNIGIQSTVPVQGSKIVGATIPIETHAHEKIITQHIDDLKHVDLAETKAGRTKEIHTIHEHPIETRVENIKVTLEPHTMHTYTTNTFDINHVKGLASCNRCHGLGYKKSKSGKYGQYRTCRECVRATKQCYFCNNQGYLIEYPDKRCACYFGENLGLQHTGGNFNMHTSGNTFDLGRVKGLKDCNICQGLGYRKSKSGKYGEYKTCWDCVNATKQCYFCNNQGYLLQYPERRCACYFGENIGMQQMGENYNIHTKGKSFDMGRVKGLKECKKCQGLGYKNSKSRKYGKYKTCKDCVNMTKQCYFCDNKGVLLEFPDRRCACHYGNNLGMKI